MATHAWVLHGQLYTGTKKLDVLLKYTSSQNLRLTKVRAGNGRLHQKNKSTLK